MTTELPKTMTLPDGKVIPIFPFESGKTPSREAAALQKSAERASKNAVRAAFAKGLPVTIGRNGKILRLYPDGHEEIIGEYPAQ